MDAIRQGFVEFIFQPNRRASTARLFYDIDISQGSVATHLRCGGIYTDHISNLLSSKRMK